jgi:hypothetical protein
MRAAALPGQSHLDPATIAALQALTAELLEAVPDARAELNRFTAASGRGLKVDADAIAAVVAGKNVLVTGGTGCIGSRLLHELRAYEPRHLVSVSRGETAPGRIDRSVQYLLADVADRDALAQVIKRSEAQVIFHAAAQRSPELAEIEVERTVRTNVIGTKNLIDVCSASDVEMIVYASSGKALRPYTNDVYAATKRMGEWLVASRGRSTLRRGFARFTHVVDNSLILGKIEAWRASGGVVELHGSQISFFIQSARESAELLLATAAEAAEMGDVPLLAIRNLEAPTDLTALALGVIAASEPLPPIYFSGFKSGYENAPYAGLYLPETSVDVSRLLNAFEARIAGPAPSAPDVDMVVSPPYATANATAGKLADLESACTDGSDAGVRSTLDALLRELLDRYLELQPRELLDRIVEFTTPWRQTMDTEHLLADDAVRAARASAV